MLPKQLFLGFNLIFEILLYLFALGYNKVCWVLNYFKVGQYLNSN